jgi:GH24 family phage-related lysozyme (muramidase)
MMEKFYGNYLGLCINNADPEFRGRVQIFIPHILPALYDRWNKEGKNIKIEIVGNNLGNALSQADIETLKKMLPWSEAAAPVFGNSAAGYYNPASGNFNQTSVTENEATSAALGNANVSGSLSDFVKGFEGFSPTAYRDGGTDQNPKYSIGYGTRATGPNDPAITEQEATARLQQELAEANSAVNTALTNRNITGLTSRQIEALTSFTYNTGPGNLALLLDSAGGRRDWSTISNAMVLYNRQEGTNRVLRGLTRRRNAEVAFGNVNSPSGSSSGVTLNDPASVGLPGSANPAQHLPQLAPDNQTYTSNTPQQQAILDAAEATLASAGGATPGGRKNNFDFNEAVKGAGELNTGRMTYCGRGTRYIAGHITGANFTLGFNGNDFSNANTSLTSPITTPGLPGQGKQVLYNNVGFIQGTSYVPQQGDVILHSKGIRGGRFGHAHIFVNGQWHSFKTEGQTNSALQGYLNVSGQRSQLFRLTAKGQEAMLALGRADTDQLGIAYEGEGGITTDSIAGDENNNNEFDGSLVSNPTSNQPSVTDTTGMPQGLFSVPNPGAMLWVFFREGDPLYPVYFAASYGAQEWKNVMKAGSPGAHYPTAGDTTPRNQAIFRPNQSGGISFVDTLTEEENARSIRVFHENGGHMEWHHHGSTLYSPNEHIQQVAGSLYDSCTYRSFWTQGKHEDITIGDRVVIVGNASREALDYIEQHAQIVKDINKNMLKNGGTSESSSPAPGSSPANRSTIESSGTNSVANFFGRFGDLISGPISNNTPPTPTQQA